MTLKQLENLIEIDQDITDDAYGTYYDKRTIEQLLNNGLILLDKPPGPTSHETVAWTKRILKLEKIGHSGTLDPQVSGVLPLGLGEATKALGVLLLGPKEYHALGRVHSLPSKEKLSESINTHMSEDKRPIPFDNMIYIGDGLTDVPSMALIKKEGGHSIAVGKPVKVCFCEPGCINHSFKDIHQ